MLQELLTKSQHSVFAECFFVEKKWTDWLQGRNHREKLRLMR